MTRTFSRLAACTAAALALAPAVAMALPARIWVSPAGTDTAGCGPVNTPCRTFQYAHDNIASGGEIAVRDPGGYGPVTITKSVSIVNDGVGTAGMAITSGNAITVQAGNSDSVAIRGISMDGTGTANNGIRYISGGSLSVINCVARHFAFSGGNDTGAGLAVVPTSGTLKLDVIGTILSDNGGDGFAYFPPSGGATVQARIASSVIDHNAFFGIYAENTLTTQAASIALSITDTSSSFNGFYGIDTFASPGSVKIDARRVTLHANGTAGITVFGQTTVSLADSTITQNGTNGIDNNLGAGKFVSFGGNVVTGNPTSVNGTALTTSPTI